MIAYFQIRGFNMTYHIERLAVLASILFHQIYAFSLNDTLSKTVKVIIKWIESIPIDPKTFLALCILGLILFLLGLVFICCKYVCKTNHEPKPLKDKLNLDEDRIFGPDLSELLLYCVDMLDYNIESSATTQPNEIKLPTIKYSLNYKNDENILHLTVHETNALPPPRTYGTLCLFVKVLLKPVSKKTFKTSEKKYNGDVIFEDEVEFVDVSYTDLVNSTIMLRVFDHHLTSRLVNEAIVPVKDLVIGPKRLTDTKILLPEFKSEAGLFNKDSGLGHICIGLSYSISTSVLTVIILSCRKLEAKDENGTSDPYVTMFLVYESKKIKKRKTTVKQRNVNPVFNESFSFMRTLNDLEDTSIFLIVADYDKGEIGDPIGQCFIGQMAVGLGAKHWSRMRQNPGKPVCNWHMLRPVESPE